MMNRLIFILTFLLAGSTGLLAQEYVFIQPLTDMLDQGRAGEVRRLLPALTAEHPGDPGIEFLQAVFMTDADEAVSVYRSVVEKHPASFAAIKSAERLVNYYTQKNDPASARQYLDFLGKEPVQAVTVIPSVPAEKPAAVPVKETPLPKSGKKEPVKKPAAEEKPAAAPAGKYFIQAGAFAMMNQADKVLKKAKAKGFSGKVIKEVTNNKIFYKVRIGPYPTEEEAETGVSLLKTKLSINGFVVED